MLRLKTFLLGAAVGAGGMFGAHRYHLVHTPDGLIVVRRTEHVQLWSTYADVRNWDAARWEQSPELQAALREDGRSDLLDLSRLDRASVLGGLPDAAPAGDVPSGGRTARPPIVFEQPVPVGATERTRPSMPEAAEPDSLLGRLSRQLRGEPIGGTTDRPADGLRERPLSRRTAEPSGGAQSAGGGASSIGDERAAAPVQPLPGDVLPSIHAAALERVTPTGEPAGASTAGRTNPPLSSAVEGISRSVSEAISSKLVTGGSPGTGENWSRSLVRETLPPHEGAPPSSSRGSTAPMDVDASRLRSRVPASVQEGWRTIAPAWTPPGESVVPQL